MATYYPLLEAVLNRLLGHSVAATGILGGFKTIMVYEAATEGESDLPRVRFAGETTSETHVPGSVPASSMTLQFSISTDRAKGPAEALKALEKFMNALEVNPTTQKRDQLIERLVSQPPSYKTDRVLVSPLAITREVSVNLAPSKFAERGNR